MVRRVPIVTLRIESNGAQDARHDLLTPDLRVHLLPSAALAAADAQKSLESAEGHGDTIVAQHIVVDRCRISETRGALILKAFETVPKQPAIGIKGLSRPTSEQSDDVRADVIWP
jgi:hypothetical protein